MSELRSDKKVSGQSGVGVTLRTRREQLGWAVEDVADALKLRPSMLNALEEEAYDRLPGKVYSLGFVKSYASYLGLDADKIVASLDRQLLDHTDSIRSPAFSVPYPQSERGISVFALLGIGLVVVVAAYTGWYHFANHDSALRGMPPASLSMSDNASSAQGEHRLADSKRSNNVEVPSAGEVTSQERDGSHLNSANVQKEEAAQQADITPEPSPISKDSSAGSSSVSSPEPGTSIEPTSHRDISPFVPQKPNAQDSSLQNSATAASSTTDDAHSVTVILTQDSWIQIKNAQGKVLEARLMKKDERWQGRDDEGPYHLTAGNAGGVVVHAGSVTSAPLGRVGTVRRNVALTPQDIMNGQYGRSEQAVQTTH